MEHGQAPGLPHVSWQSVVAQTRTSVLTPDEFISNLNDKKQPTEELVKRKEGRAKLTSEHKVFIMNYVKRHQQ